nr:hypothetical protein [Neisseria weixii]
MDYAGQNPITPRELTNQEVKDLVQAFQDSVKRAVAAGFDTIELHGARLSDSSILFTKIQPAQR